MIQLDRSSCTYAGCTYQLNNGYREFGRIVTVEAFAIYRPTGEILPLVKNEIGRTYFSHWDNLKPIPLGQIELFGYSDADPNEPPEPFELDDIPKPGRLTAKDIPDKSEWRCRSKARGREYSLPQTLRGLHPVKPVVGLLSEYVVRCDNLPIWEQIRLCQLRIKGQRLRIRDLRMKDRADSEVKNTFLIIEEEKQRIHELLKKYG